MGGNKHNFPKHKTKKMKFPFVNDFIISFQFPLFLKEKNLNSKSNYAQTSF